MSRFQWTPELEAELLRLKGEKKSNAEIAYAMGLNISQVKNRLIYIKTRKSSPPPQVVAPISEGEAQKSELNDLEAALAETITELTAERDALEDKLDGYEKDYGELLQKNEKCLEQIAELKAMLDAAVAGQETLQEALGITEIQLDEARREAEEHLSKVGEQIKTISKLDKRVSVLERELEGANEDIVTLQGTIALRNKDIDDLTGRLVRAAEKAGQLLTQCLMTGD